MRTRLVAGTVAVLLCIGVISASAAWNRSTNGTASTKAASIAAPTSFTTSSVTSSSVTLNWTAPSNPSPSGYVLTRNGATVTTGGCSSLPATATSCVDGGLAASTTYNYVLRATLSNWSSATTSVSPTTSAAAVFPTVLSIDRNSATPTKLGSVQWVVTFSSSVTGVGTADFALANTGLTNPSITNVTGSGATYTVQASTGSGDGSLGLNLSDDDSIVDGSGNKLGGTGTGNGNFTGQVYVVDKTAPTRTALEMFDTNGNGKIDQVRATYDEPLAASPTGTWSASNIPSGGSAGSASISGNQALLTITEGAGAADTAVGNFKVALASPTLTDAAGNAVATFNDGPADKAAPVPVAVLLANGNHGNAGAIDDGKDSLSVMFSEAVTKSSVCTGWNSGSLDVGITVTNLGGSDKLTITALGSSCGGAVNFGSVSLGGDYIAGSNGSTATWAESGSSASTLGVSGSTLTVSFGNKTAGGQSINTGVAAGTPTFSPSSSLADAAANTMTTSTFTATSTSSF